MITFNHDGKDVAEACNISAEEFGKIATKIRKEFNQLVPEPFLVSNIAEGLQTWVTTGTDTERAVKFMYLARAANTSGMI